MRGSNAVKKYVLAELEWEPAVDAAAIGVAVADGVVTLTGHVRSLGEREAAEKAVSRVLGVAGIANELVVRVPSSMVRDDTDLARAAVDALKWNTRVPDTVEVVVRDGRVALEGEVDWQYQRRAAEKTVRDLVGVRGVVNRLRLRQLTTPDKAREAIEAALQRNAEIDCDGIAVTVAGSKATLSGYVRSWTERNAAESEAWGAPGITEVDNGLRIATAVPAL